MAMSMGMVLKNVRWNRGIRFFPESPTSLYRILVLAKRRVAGTFIIPATLRLARTRIRFSVGCV